MGALADHVPAPAGLPYLCACVNNDVSSLSYPLSVNSEVRFLTMADPHGWRIYRKSLCFLLAKAIRDTFPDAVFSVGHAFGSGLYCNFTHRRDEARVPVPEDLAVIEARMLELVGRELPIERRKVAYTDAVREFEESGQEDKLNLLKYRNPPRIVIHACDGFTDLAHGPLVPHTGLLQLFKLIPYPPGFILHHPTREAPHAIPAFDDQPHLFQIFQEHKEWGRILGVTTVGRLNRITAEGELDEFIQTAEALHEKKLARIADAITAAPDPVKLILIAGPSSAGKTTFSKRLRTHLMVNGVRPLPLSVDDYFVGAELNPVDEDGRPDYEHLEAVDLALFNDDLRKLIGGQEIAVPTFNFERKCREYRGKTLQLAPDQMLIVEGIHALNPRLSEAVPVGRKFGIYVSALTQLNVDSNNRISTTDNRLMRRMVRDHKFRGHSPLATLRMWPSVRRGEKRWIFPFQREADATFNSALDYELAVLKFAVEPLLMQVKPSDPEYAEARRLSEFLLNFLGAPDRAVPGTSILREYIGRSTFRY